jgi:hypothetical protein
VVCEIHAWRGYVYGEFVAIQNREWVIARSGGFRWPRRELVPPKSAAAEQCLAQLRQRLIVLGWEDEGVTRQGAWYAMSFSSPDRSVRSPLPSASQPLAQAVAPVGPGLPEPESVHVGEAPLDGPQPHEPAGPDVLSLVQPEQPATGVESREGGRQALAATADAGVILAQATQLSADVHGLPQDAGASGALGAADARPVLPPVDHTPAVVEEPAQDFDHLPASPVAGAVPLFTELEQASSLPEGEPLANAGERDQARTSPSPVHLKRLRRASRRAGASASAAVAAEVALADEQAPVELESAFVGPEPGRSDRDECDPAQQEVAGSGASGLDTAPLALVGPDSAAAELPSSFDDGASAWPSPVRLGLATPCSSEGDPLDPYDDPETAEEPEYEPTPEPGGLEPWYRKPRSDPVPVEVDTELCTRIGAYTRSTGRLTGDPRRPGYQP